MTDFAFGPAAAQSAVPGPVGSAERAYLYAPGANNSGGLLDTLDLTESSPGLFTGTHSLTLADNASLPYEYEVKQRDPQGNYTIQTVGRGDYGYLFGGQWAQFEAVGTATSFWTSQSQVEQQYGPDNTGLDADLNDNGAGVAAVWQAALNFTDALIDRIFARAGFARPTDLTLTDYVLASGYAADIVRNQLHMARGSFETNAAGGPSTGGVFQKAADAAVEALEDMAEEGVAFPRVAVDAGGQGNAPQELRITEDAYGRPVGPVTNRWRPYWDEVLGTYRW